jgi:hypothetical protein
MSFRKGLYDLLGRGCMAYATLLMWAFWAGLILGVLLLFIGIYEMVRPFLVRLLGD